MLFEYTYLLSDFNAVFFNDTDGQVSDFIIPINHKIIGKKPELFQILLNSKNRFCFYIPLELTQYSNKFIKEEIIQNIVRLLFLPNYMRIHGKYIFFIEKIEEKDKTLDLLKNEFYIELKKQGINDIIIEILQTEPLAEILSNEKCISLFHNELNSYLSSDKEECFKTFTEKFVLPANFYKKWIVPVTNAVNLHYKIKLIEKFENWLVHADPFKVQLIKMYKLAGNSAAELELENKILKFKLENNSNSLKLIREESSNFKSEIARLTLLAQQAINPDTEKLIMQLRTQIVEEQNRVNEILVWYKKEYEVLPKWYKRFGHIVKVFTGKRTLKSLFNKILMPQKVSK